MGTKSLHSVFNMSQPFGDFRNRIGSKPSGCELWILASLHAVSDTVAKVQRHSVWQCCVGHLSGTVERSKHCREFMGSYRMSTIRCAGRSGSMQTWIQHRPHPELNRSWDGFFTPLILLCCKRNGEDAWSILWRFVRTNGGFDAKYTEP